VAPEYVSYGLKTNLMKHVFTLLSFAVMSSGIAQVPEYVPADGLVAWYPLDGSGTDVSGNDVHLSENEVTSAVNRFNQPEKALQFNGESSYLLRSTALDLLENSDSFSVKFWAKAGPTSTVEPQCIFYEGFPGEFHFANADPGTDFTSFHWAAKASGNVWYGPGHEIDTDWFHVVGVQNAGLLTLYIDGQVIDSVLSASCCVNAPNDQMVIGARRVTSYIEHPFDGAIDDLGLWNRALTEEEILTLYLLEQPIPGCTETGACNYEPTATQDDGSCDYTCCPGPGCCDVGMHWDWELGMCQITNVADTNLDGCVQLNDLLDVLSAYGDCGVLENEVQVISNPNFEIADGIYNQWPELTIALRAAFSDSTGSSNIYRQIEGGEMGLNHSDGKLSFSLKASNGNCFTAAGWVAVETDLTDDDLHSIIARYSRLTGEFSLAIDGEIMVVSAINSGDLADCNLYNGEIGFPSDKAWSLEEIGFYDFVWSEEMVASYADCVPLTSLDMESAQLILPSGVSIDEVEELLSPYAPITVTGTSGFLPCE